MRDLSLFSTFALLLCHYLLDIDAQIDASWLWLASEVVVGWSYVALLWQPEHVEEFTVWIWLASNYVVVSCADRH